jgi:hypothetical protein
MRIATVVLLLALYPAGSAQGSTNDHWLAERAGSSDIVVLAQLDRVDYEYRRDFPVDGEAWLRPLIPYKSPRPLTGILVVSEQGLSDNECYFPRVDPWEEQPRYLLFLNRDRDDGTLEGHADGCAIEVLVNASGRYAARWPQPAFGGDHGRGGERLQKRVREMTFQGPMARIDASDMLAHRRRARAERDFMEIDGSDLLPTRGIEITALRELMQPGLEPDEDEETPSARLEELRDRMLQRARESAAEDDGGG